MYIFISLLKIQYNEREVGAYTHTHTHIRIVKLWLNLGTPYTCVRACVCVRVCACVCVFVCKSPLNKHTLDYDICYLVYE